MIPIQRASSLGVRGVDVEFEQTRVRRRGAKGAVECEFPGAPL